MTDVYIRCQTCRLTYHRDSIMADMHESGVCVEASRQIQDDIKKGLMDILPTGDGWNEALTCPECHAFDSHEPDCQYAKEGSAKPTHGVLSAVDKPAVRRIGFREWEWAGRDLDTIRGLCERGDI